MALTPGTTLGPYAVTAKIGEGGMGEVYRARDTKLDRDVALKVLPQAFTDDPDRLARFEREAKVLALLNHPNIGGIHGLEESDGIRALVLEYIEGPTLADRIAQGAIPVDEALPIAKQIAEALEAAHEAGVIHRDLKPANVKVRPDGTVKVLDFGLSKAMQSDASDPSLSQSPTVSLTAAATQMGMVIGTAAYMAPEQASGKVVDKRADVWAFGVVLYEMLTGARPFKGDDVSHTLAAVLMKEIDWTALSKDTPGVVRRLLRRCLERDPRKRMRDIGEARLELDDPQPALSTMGEVEPRQLQVWQRPIPLAIAAMGIAAIASTAVWIMMRPAAPPPGLVSRFPLPLAVDQVFTGLSRPLVAISPDGSQVVYVANDSLWLRRVDQLQATQVPGTEGAQAPFFSADGQSIGFWSASQLKRVAVSGGATVALADGVANIRGASWDADDKILYGQAEGIMQVSGAGGTPELLIPVGDGETVQGPQMLPGGEWVLFSVRAAQELWDEAQVVVQSVTTGDRMVLIAGGQDGRYLSTGHLVYGSQNVLLAVPFDVRSRAVTGGPVPLVDGVRLATGGQGAAQFSVSATGSLTYVPGSRGSDSVVTLTWVTRDGEEEMISAPARAYGRPRVSPDGTRVAVDINDDGSRDIWIWDLARETLTQLTFDEANDNYPLWTPDAARILFTSSRDGGGLFWKAADGTGQVERIKDGPLRPYAWTEDGELVFEQEYDIGVLAPEGERTVQILLDEETRAGEPSLSPDGRWLAYYAIDRDPNVYVRQFPSLDGLWKVSSDYGVQPVWARNGRELFYNGGTDLMMARIETDPTFSRQTPEPLFSMSGYALSAGPDDARMWDLAPDGDRFVFRKPTRQTGDDAVFNGLIFVENWFQELTERVPIP